MLPQFFIMMLQALSKEMRSECLEESLNAAYLALVSGSLAGFKEKINP